MNKINLKEAFEGFQKIPFPNNPTQNEEFSGIFSELALFDMYIAGHVQSILSHNKRIDLEFNPALENRLYAFLAKNNLTGVERIAALEIKHYLREINVLIAKAKEYLRVT